MRRLTPAQSSHLTTQLYIERVHRRLPTTHASPLVACSLARSTSCLQGQRGWFDPRGSSFEMVPVRENWERFEYNLYKIINPRNKENMRVEEAEAVTMRFYRGIPGIKIKLRRNWVVSLINWNPKNAPRSCFRGTWSLRITG